MYLPERSKLTTDEGMTITMKKKLFGGSIEPNCEYCSHSSNTNGSISCVIGHSIDSNGNCRRFAYDPLLRTPKSLPPLKKHDADEFKL